MKYDLERMIFLVCTVLWPSFMGFDVVYVSEVTKSHLVVAEGFVLCLSVTDGRRGELSLQPGVMRKRRCLSAALETPSG
jgi:hypothetical protein